MANTYTKLDNKLVVEESKTVQTSFQYTYQDILNGITRATEELNYWKNLKTQADAKGVK